MINSTGEAEQQFEALGKKAPIRGNFDITAEKLKGLCKGSFAPYAVYAGAIVEDCAEYGINPLFILADFINQAVYPPYLNPWGISKDKYPYGPNGSELGQKNGKVKDGPRKFGKDEWRIAFDRQFKVVAKGNAYAKATTIEEWAKIDAPEGAPNDVHHTNAREAEDVGALYDRLVKALNG